MRYQSSPCVDVNWCYPSIKDNFIVLLSHGPAQSKILQKLEKYICISEKGHMNI